MKRLLISLLFIAATHQAFGMRRTLKRLPNAQSAMQLSQLFVQGKYNEAFLLAQKNRVKLNINEKYLLRNHLEKDIQKNKEIIDDSNILERNHFWVTFPISACLLIDPSLTNIDFLLGLTGTYCGMLSFVKHYSFQYTKELVSTLGNKLKTFDLIFTGKKEEQLKTK